MLLIELMRTYMIFLVLCIVLITPMLPAIINTMQITMVTTDAGITGFSCNNISKDNFTITSTYIGTNVDKQYKNLFMFNYKLILPN